MRLSPLLAALASVPAVLGFKEQTPLNGKHGKLHGGSSSADQHAAAAPPYRQTLIDLHRNLVSIPSISGDEYKVGQWLVDYLISRNFRADIQFVAPREGTPDGAQRFNVLAWPGRHDADPKPKVLVTSHIDVVPPFISYGIEDGPITKDTVIKGRGSVDAKAAVAAMTVAVEELVAAGRIHNDDVMLLFVVGEEVSGDGMVAFSDAVLAREEPPSWHAVVFGEPTESKLVCGHKGMLSCNLQVRGVASHSGYPWLGKSANELLVRAAARIMDADLGSSELYGNSTFNLGIMQGGIANNVVPASASAKFSVRVAIGPQDGGQLLVKKKIEDILAEVDEDAFEMTCVPGYGTVNCNCDVEGKYTFSELHIGVNTNHLQVLRS